MSVGLLAACTRGTAEAASLCSVGHAARGEATVRTIIRGQYLPNSILWPRLSPVVTAPATCSTAVCVHLSVFARSQELLDLRGGGVPPSVEAETVYLIYYTVYCRSLLPATLRAIHCPFYNVLATTLTQVKQRNKNRYHHHLPGMLHLATLPNTLCRPNASVTQYRGK